MFSYLLEIHIGALFLLGFLGSGHCVGMCGPLILAFPAQHQGLSPHLIYSAGRILTYTFVGALFGSINLGLKWLGHSQNALVITTKIQIIFSAIAAIFLFFFGLTKLGFIKEPEVLSFANPGRFWGFRRLNTNLRQSKKHILISLFFLGMLLGLLPCGLSFAAFSRALGAQGPLSGALMTLSFGLGTLPSLLFVGLGAAKLSQRSRKISDLIAGMLMIGMAISLGFNLFR